MASLSPSSSSLTTSMLPFTRNLVELTTDPKLIYPAVFNAIANVEKLNGLLPPLISLVVTYLEVWKEERGGSIFGEIEWTDHFGTVPPAPPLPPGIEEIWQGPCPIYSGKKVYETHMFVYLPVTVNGFPLTLNSLGRLVKNYFPETYAGYPCMEPSVAKQAEDNPSDHACWVLMTNEGIPESGDKNFVEQRNIVAALAKTALPLYEVPRTLDAAVCILGRFISSKRCLFSNNYIRCQENVEGSQVIVGKFSPDGLMVLRNYYDCATVVVAGMRKFLSPCTNSAI